METKYYFRGEWGGERQISLPISLHGLWNGCSVFDGARSLGGLVPDLLPHCARLVAAAPSMLLKAPLSATEVARIAIEGVRRFPEDTQLYIMPLFFSTTGGLIPDAEGTEFMLTVFEKPLPEGGMRVCGQSGIIRPAPGTMQTAYKASWLYANAAPAKRDAAARGFDDVIMRDPAGHVVEFSTANLWLVRDGRLMTPPAEGSILPGITRARIITLLRAAGVPFEERHLTDEDVAAATEIFSSGNSAQIRPVTQVDDRVLVPGRVTERVQGLYRDWLKTQTIEVVARSLMTAV